MPTWRRGASQTRKKFADIFYGWPLIYTIEEVGRICITPQTYLRSQVYCVPSTAVGQPVEQYILHTMYMYVVRSYENVRLCTSRAETKDPFVSFETTFQKRDFYQRVPFFLSSFFPTCGFPRGFSNKFLSYELKILIVIEKCDYFLPRQNFQCLILFRASFFFLFLLFLF